jgi:hypothetical protein
MSEAAEPIGPVQPAGCLADGVHPDGYRWNGHPLHPHAAHGVVAVGAISMAVVVTSRPAVRASSGRRGQARHDRLAGRWEMSSSTTASRCRALLDCRCIAGEGDPVAVDTHAPGSKLAMNSLRRARSAAPCPPLPWRTAGLIVAPAALPVRGCHPGGIELQLGVAQSRAAASTASLKESPVFVPGG